MALPGNTSYIAIFLHNKGQMYFPKFDEIYGSNLKTIKIKKELIEKNASVFMMDYEVKMMHWKALDTEDKRCDNSNLGNVTGCIAKYIEKEIGCSMNLALSEPNLERYLIIFLSIYPGNHHILIISHEGAIRPHNVMNMTKYITSS